MVESQPVAKGIAATPASGFWSLMSGLVLVTTLQACGFLYA
jgi:hypothetical protein